MGKSSLLNSLTGRKVVSVSRTPGHTKHLQTIFLTKSVRLCDCPGLVFPSLVSKPLQILAGIYPIAQLQEPYSAIRYLAERVPIIKILRLEHPASDRQSGEAQFSDKEKEWSPLDVCEAWAIKRGYFTAKASRPDVYRAANELLRMALDGRLSLSLKPRDYFKNFQSWQEHPETIQLGEISASVEKMAKDNRHVFKFNEINNDSSNESGASSSNSDDENDSKENRKTDDTNEEKETTATENEDAVNMSTDEEDSLDEEHSDSNAEKDSEDEKYGSSYNPYELLHDEND